MTSQRCIVMPTGRRVPLGAYVRAVKVAKAHPDRLFADNGTVALFGWAVTGREFRRMFRAGIHDRINQAVPAVERGLVAR